MKRKLIGWCLCLTALFSFMQSANAGLTVVEVEPKYFDVYGHFETIDEARTACRTFLTGVPIYNYTDAVCNYNGSATTVLSLWATYLPAFEPDGQNVAGFYSLSIYACSTTPPSAFRYFDDVRTCVTVDPYAASPLPSDPKGIGSSCPSNPQNHQPACGNPISPGTGNKVQQESDYLGSGSQALSFSRTYNGGLFITDQNSRGGFGAWWTQPYERRLTVEPVRTTMLCYVRSDNNRKFCESSPVSGGAIGVAAIRSDGKVYHFSQGANGLVNDADVDDRLTAQYAADGTTVTGWTYIAANGETTESYDESGKLLSLTARTGVRQVLTYSTGLSNDTSTSRYPASAPVCSNVQAGAVVTAGLPVCVTDDWGHQLQFEYDSSQRIVRMLDPALNAFVYAYDGPSGGCPVGATLANRACSENNLTQVTYPDGRAKIYHYNEAAQINGGNACQNSTAVSAGYAALPHALTGITDENGVRFATWTYDCDGIAISSEHAGGVEKIALAYGVRSSDGAQTVTATSYLGTAANPIMAVRNYHSLVILGVSKNDAVDSPCQGCFASRTYDGNGNVATSTDWNGVKTSYGYDLLRNLETSRIEAAGSVQPRTISTAWHTGFRLPLQVAAPLQLSTFTYDSRGNLLTATVQATTDVNGAAGFGASVTGLPQQTAYSYNPLGQLLTVTGPRAAVGDITRYTYDGVGNLATVTNAAGHVTSLSNYDANGRVGHIVAPSGITTDLAYTLRGWLASRVVTSGAVTEATSYEYDGVGQLVRVMLPDSSSIDYTYDDAHRLISINDSFGNSIRYTLDLVGNRIEEQIADNAGTLVQQVSRVYDQLNRLQVQTGIAQ